MSCAVYWSGEDESFSSDWQQSRRLFSLACPAALYQSSCFPRSASSSLSRLRSEQSAISPCKAAELNRSEETKKKKRKKKKRTLFSSGTFFQLGIKAAVFVRMENTMMLQLDHWDTYTSSDIHTVYIPHHMRKSWQSRSIYCEAVWQSEYKSDKNHFCLVVSQPYKKEPYVSVHGPLLQQKSAEVTCP